MPMRDGESPTDFDARLKADWEARKAPDARILPAADYARQKALMTEAQPAPRPAPLPDVRGMSGSEYAAVKAARGLHTDHRPIRGAAG